MILFTSFRSDRRYSATAIPQNPDLPRFCLQDTKAPILSKIQVFHIMKTL